MTRLTSLRGDPEDTSGLNIQSAGPFGGHSARRHARVRNFTSETSGRGAIERPFAGEAVSPRMWPETRM